MHKTNQIIKDPSLWSTDLKREGLLIFMVPFLLALWIEFFDSWELLRIEDCSLRNIVLYLRFFYDGLQASDSSGFTILLFQMKFYQDLQLVNLFRRILLWLSIILIGLVRNYLNFLLAAACLNSERVNFYPTRFNGLNLVKLEVVSFIEMPSDRLLSSEKLFANLVAILSLNMSIFF